jgi:predicted GNAT family N-acyltransferase
MGNEGNFAAGRMDETRERSVVEIEFGSPLYREELILRDEILRKPLGLKLTERTEDEADCRHFGLVEAGHLSACLIVVPRGAGLVQIRQMAVRSDRQGCGLGRLLMKGAEAAIRAAGVQRIFLNARHTAVGFYEKLGYHPVGEGFIEVGIPHQRMEKTPALITER